MPLRLIYNNQANPFQKLFFHIFQPEANNSCFSFFSAGELGNAVQDAFVIAVEQQARERLQRLSALKRITPVDMSQLSIKVSTYIGKSEFIYKLVCFVKISFGQFKSFIHQNCVHKKFKVQNAFILDKVGIVVHRLIIWTAAKNRTQQNSTFQKFVGLEN